MNDAVLSICAAEAREACKGEPDRCLVRLGVAMTASRLLEQPRSATYGQQVTTAHPGARGEGKLPDLSQMISRD